MNILIVNQSVIDSCGSLLTVLSAVVEVSGTGLSADNVYDQFICRFWHTRILLWTFLITSTYNIFLMALERYIAVIYPMWYNKNVSIVLVKFHFSISQFTNGKFYGQFCDNKIVQHLLALK